MAIPTVAQIFERARYLLDDPDPGSDPVTYETGVIFPDAVLRPAFSEGYDVVFAAMLELQAAKIKRIATYTLPALTTELTPATIGINDFGELVSDGLRERSGGAETRYIPLYERNRLPQRTMGSRLEDFVWREDTFEFIGATQPVYLQIEYYASGAAPEAGLVGIDGSLTAFGYLTAGIAGTIKGHGEGETFQVRALGKSYVPGDYGTIGGEVSRLLGPALRARDRVPIQPQAFSLSRYTGFRRAPSINIAAQPAGTGEMPITMQYSDGTISGTLDGENPTFNLSIPVTHANVYLNGVLLELGTGYSHTLNIVTFLVGYIPNPGDSIRVEGWTG